MVEPGRTEISLSPAPHWIFQVFLSFANLQLPNQARIIRDLADGRIINDITPRENKSGKKGGLGTCYI